MNSNSSLVSRIGFGAAILALIAFLIPLVALLLGAVGAVQMNTSDDITNLLSNAVIVGIIAFALAVIATLLNLPGLFSDPREGVVTLIGSALLLLLSAGFLFGMVLPRASATQNLHDNIIPFAQTMSDSCKAPLNDTIEDLTTVRNFADSMKTSDAGYAGGVGTYISILHSDDAKLVDGIQAVQEATVPDPKYQDLKDQCLLSLRSMESFLNAPGKIQVPATLAPLLAPIGPALGANAVLVNGVVASVSGFGLLNAGTLIAGSGKAPPGTAQAIISPALTTVINSKNDQLTKDGDQIVQDIKDGLTNNVAPFKMNVPVG
jgi:hypothetical protein